MTYYVSSVNARTAHDSLTKPLFSDLLRAATGLLAAEKPEQALTILEPLLSASQREGYFDSSFIAQVLFQKANSYLILNDPDHSIDLYNSAMKMTNDARKRSRLAINLGTAYFIREDYQRAVMHFKQALTLLTESAVITPALYRELSYNLGCAYFEDKDIPSSLSWWQETSRITEKYFPHDTVWIIRNLVNLGSLQFRSEDYENAGDYYRKALWHVRETDRLNSGEYVPVLKNLARSFICRGLCDSAQNVINQALALVQTVDPLDPMMVVDLLHLQGTAYRTFGWLDKSDSVFYIALSKLDSLASLRTARSDFLFSLQRFRLLRDLAFVRYLKYRQNEKEHQLFETARYSLTQAVNCYEKLTEPCDANVLADAEEDSVSLLYRRLMELTFLKYTREKCGYLDTFQKLSRVVHNSDIHWRNRIGANDQTRYALALQEKGRAVKRRLYYISKKKLELGPVAIPGYLTLDKYYFSLHRTYDSIQNILSHFLSRTQVVAMPCPAASEAFLEYTFTGSSLFVRVITRETDTLITAPQAPTLMNDVCRFVNSIKTANQKETLASGDLLFNYLIGPVRGLLSGKDKLVIVQDPSFAFLPFECLVVTDTARENNEQDHYLIRDFTISYALSLENPDMNDETILRPAYAYTFSGWAPEFPKSGGYADLPFASREIIEISYKFNSEGKRSACFSGLSADEGSFLDMGVNSQILHVATHGRPNPDENRFSGILFSLSPDDDPDPLLDGIVELGELDGIALTSELLVISSCGIDTGTCRFRNKDEFHPDLFLLSGVGNVIYSLWNVIDKYTYTLMLNFYGHYLSGDTFPTALRKAKLELLNNPYTSAPAVWGGFILKQR